ncbi:hypothetical protein BDU57DRAFT_523618 [Ampelomyces quisqualis]|uniref:Uncharacterized protein n=1 Tax=Ampelomyces quisqualis TaxID=50730 RepID=A0A6A5Q8J3_AMPQU|nr:hypothetical protein BDU57DRAFT_523618 [Ampelomyces quisqualis]
MPIQLRGRTRWKAIMARTLVNMAVIPTRCAFAYAWPQPSAEPSLLHRVWSTVSK